MRLSILFRTAAFLLLACAYANAPAQLNCSVEYEYDAAGNCTKRYWYCCVWPPCLGKMAPPADTTRSQGASSTLSKLTYTLVPNPAHTTVLVRTSAAIEGGWFEVMDMNGKVLVSAPFNGTQQEVPVADLADGAYLARIRTDQEMLITQFLVAR
jgi:Secretion system C-terminal sorting domain